MRSASPVRIADPDACVETVLTRVGRRLVVGLPVGIGKPNLLANAFVRRAAADPSIRLTIVTALSLKRPRWSSDLERRYVEPLARRVFGDYPELEYVRMLEERRLPANIEVIEFYLEPGAWLGNDAMQQHYLSSNYTHVLRDAIGRGLNVLLQLVAPPPPREPVAGMLSLGSNPDLTVDLLPQLDVLRASGRPFVLVGQHHRELPFMYGDALVPESCFDYPGRRTGVILPALCTSKSADRVDRACDRAQRERARQGWRDFAARDRRAWRRDHAARSCSGTARIPSTAKPLRPVASSSATRR